MLCQAKKGRIGSHLLGFYGDPKFKQLFPERYFDGKRKPFSIENISRKLSPEDRLKVFDQVIISRAQLDESVKHVEKEVRAAWISLSDNTSRKKNYKRCFEVLLDRFKRLKT